MTRFGILLLGVLAAAHGAPVHAQATSYGQLGDTHDDAVLLAALKDPQKLAGMDKVHATAEYDLTLARQMTVPENQVQAYDAAFLALRRDSDTEAPDRLARLSLEYLPVLRDAFDKAMRRGDFDAARDLADHFHEVRRSAPPDAGLHDMDAHFAAAMVILDAVRDARTADANADDYGSAEAKYRAAAMAFAALFSGDAPGYKRLLDLVGAEQARQATIIVRGNRVARRAPPSPMVQPRVTPPTEIAPPPPIPVPPVPKENHVEYPPPPPPPPAILPLDQVVANQNCPVDAHGRKMEGYTPVPVFYGTTRARAARPDAATETYYDNAPADPVSGVAPVDYGLAYVSVPCRHRLGALNAERPAGFVMFQFKADPNTHIMLLSATPYAGEAEFLAAVGDTVGRSHDRALLVYVHGFNQGFDAAARRTAQLGYDMDLKGAVAFFSWPSRRNLLRYGDDEVTVADPAEVAALARFLTIMRDRTGAERFYVCAHSLGSRFLLRALDRMVRAQDTPPPRQIAELVLGSPDVPDTAEFAPIWPQLHFLARRTTIYTSSKDLALMTANLFGPAERVGDGRVKVPGEGIEEVDTTEIGGQGLGHDDWASVGVDDLRSVFWFSLEPRRRCVLTSTGQAGENRWAITEANTDTDGDCPAMAYRVAMELARYADSPRAADDMLRDPIKLTAALPADLASDARPLRPKVKHVLDIATGSPGAPN